MPSRIGFYRIFLIFVVLVLTLAACSSPAAQPTSNSQPPVASDTTQPAGVPAAPAATEPPAAEPTATVPLAQPVPLELADQGFAVAPNNTVNYAFLVRNPNPAHAVQNSTFTATFYDAGGAVLGMDDLGAIELVFPGQTVGVSDALWLDNPAVASMTIALTSGEPVVMTEALPPYEVTNSSICNTALGTALRAEITSPYAANVLLPRVSILYFDAADKIIGGGYGYRSGFLANGKTGVLVWGYYAAGMDHFEVYPGYRGIPSLTTTLPSDAQPLKVTASGYALNGSTLTYAVIIENPNTAYTVDQSLLSVNAYAADGTFLTGDPLPVISLLPGQKLGISRELTLCSDETVDHIEAAIGSGDFTAPQQTAYFTSENVAFQDGSVSGDLVNQSGLEIKIFYATAIVYDANGQIIGGGSQTIDTIAADGRISVQIPVTVNGTPARAELYAVLTRKSLPK